MHVASILALVIIGSVALTYGFIESNRLLFVIGIVLLTGAVFRTFTIPVATPTLQTEKQGQTHASVSDGLKSALIQTTLVVVGSGVLLWGFLGPNRFLFAVGVALLAVTVISMFRETALPLRSRKSG